jgi:hypothetical protein
MKTREFTGQHPKARKFTGQRPKNHKLVSAELIVDVAMDGGELRFGKTHEPDSDPWFVLAIEANTGLTFRDRHPPEDEDDDADPWYDTPYPINGYVLTNGDKWYQIVTYGNTIDLYADDQESIQEAIAHGQSK